MVNKAKRYKWYSIRYKDPSVLRIKDPDRVLLDYMKKWRSTDAPPSDMMRNAEITMRTKIAEKAQYDWNARVDLESGLVQVPQIGFDEIDPKGKYVLDRQGLVESDDDDPDGLSVDGLKDMIRDTIISWSDIQLKYSAGGIAAAMKIRASRGMHEKNRQSS